MQDIIDDLENENQAHLKKRHGCVTAWLVLMIILNSLSTISYVFMGDIITSQLSSSPSRILLLALGGFGLVNVLCAIYIMKWKKIGFYGFAITSLILIPINISMDIGIFRSLSGLLGLALLYGVLQIRNDKGQSAWDGLE